MHVMHWISNDINILVLENCMHFACDSKNWNISFIVKSKWNEKKRRRRVYSEYEKLFSFRFSLIHRNWLYLNLMEHEKGKVDRFLVLCIGWHFDSGQSEKGGKRIFIFCRIYYMFMYVYYWAEQKTYESNFNRKKKKIIWTSFQYKYFVYKD